MWMWRVKVGAESMGGSPFRSFVFNRDSSMDLPSVAGIITRGSITREQEMPLTRCNHVTSRLARLRPNREITRVQISVTNSDEFRRKEAWPCDDGLSGAMDGRHGAQWSQPCTALRFI